MKEDLNNFIRELSEEYDSDSGDTYVSLYFSKNSDNKFLQRRIRACKAILKGEELENFTETIKQIQDKMEKNIGDNFAIFSSNKNKFLEYFSLPVEVENLLVVDSSPYLRPLARIQDEWESFTLLLVNTNFAKIFSVSMGKVEETKKLSADIMNRHKKGGQSQARFNRLRRGAIHEFLKEVVEALQDFSDEKIILAGPGQAKLNLKDMLPKNLSEKIIEVVDVDIDDEKEILQRSFNIVSENEKEESLDAVEHLKEEILKDGLAVYGARETLTAVKNGQVEQLIIQKDKKLPGWICEHCQVVGTDAKKQCPYCDGDVSQVDVLEEILEFAERTDAKIEFTDSTDLENLGYVGGILRYK